MFQKECFLREKLPVVVAYWAVYGTAIAAFSTIPYYVSLFRTEAAIRMMGVSIQQIMLLLLSGFSLMTLLSPRCVAFRETRIFSTLVAIRLFAAGVFLRGSIPVLPQREKVSLLLLLVKLVFVPLMAAFLFGNAVASIHLIGKLFSSPMLFSAEMILNVVYPFLLSFILAIDVSVFLAGYLIESPACDNVVRSVEDTALGWLFALACYPPFNNVTEKLFGWHAGHSESFGHVGVDVVMGGAAVAFMAVYVWSSVTLGLKASNLTNRGIVSNGPYRLVRHPAYIAKNLSWFIVCLPAILFSFFDLCSIRLSDGLPEFFHYFLIFVASLATPAIWGFIYYMRAVTEERHLMRDPEYQTYAERVKWRFLPGLL